MKLVTLCFSISLGCLLTPVRTLNAEQDESAFALRQVVLYSAGLGTFHYEGDVHEASVFSIEVPTPHVSRVLRTISVNDPAKQVAFVRVAARQDPVVSSTEGPSVQSRIELLLSLRGRRLELLLDDSSILTGKLAALESSLEAYEGEMVERVRMMLSTNHGMESVLLEDVARFRCLNESVQRGIESALTQLIADSKPSLSQIHVGFKTAERRTVQIALQRPEPVWKSSYTLIDSDLTMRIVVDNTSDNDWNNVVLTVADGLPVSFDVDLHQIARLKRPSVDLPIGLPGLPPLFSESRFPSVVNNHVSTPGLDAGGMGMDAGMGGGMFGGAAGFGSGGMGGSIAPYPQNLSIVTSAPQTTRANSLGLTTDAKLAESSEGTGDSFVLSFPSVSIPAKTTSVLTSAKLEFSTETVSIYAEHYNSTTPLLASNLVNQSEFLLPSGPITFYERSQYVGEALLPRLSPRRSRLISYALDGAVRVEPLPVDLESVVASVQCDDIKKRLTVETLKTKIESFRISNRSASDRHVVIELAIDTQVWTADLLPGDEKFDDKVRGGMHVPSQTEATRDIAFSKREQRVFSYEDVPLETLRELAKQLAGKTEQLHKLKLLASHRTRHDRLKDEIGQTSSDVKEKDREIDRVVRILSSKGLRPETMQKYADRIERLEEERSVLSAQLHVQKAELKTHSEFLIPALDATFEANFEDPFGGSSDGSNPFGVRD